MALQVLLLLVWLMDQDRTLGKEILEAFHQVQWKLIVIVSCCLTFYHLTVVIIDVWLQTNMAQLIPNMPCLLLKVLSIRMQ